ncbi:hypothetical protein [Paraferrimonas sp. SM1919]|uniref:hypothetical protein n=1 Tax=Paraferrimonas sp. SM1919 TaxID=2662263 RepID=UPI0013CFCD8A|nr:hypothetical protein [Paraferrimonas sp. SM1919]
MKPIYLSMLLWGMTTATAEEVYSVDRYIPTNLELAFKNEDKIYAEVSDFKIEHFVLMSSETGLRQAVITLTNHAAGRRSLQAEHLLATLADGSRVFPELTKLNFEGGQTLTLTADFGQSDFPILTVNTREH